MFPFPLFPPQNDGSASAGDANSMQMSFGWRFVHLLHLLPRIKRQLCALTIPSSRAPRNVSSPGLWQQGSSWELALKNANIPLSQSSENVAGTF